MHGHADRVAAAAPGQVGDHLLVPEGRVGARARPTRPRAGARARFRLIEPCRRCSPEERSQGQVPRRPSAARRSGSGRSRRSRPPARARSACRCQRNRVKPNAAQVAQPGDQRPPRLLGGRLANRRLERLDPPRDQIERMQVGVEGLLLRRELEALLRQPLAPGAPGRLPRSRRRAPRDTAADRTPSGPPHSSSAPLASGAAPLHRLLVVGQCPLCEQLVGAHRRQPNRARVHIQPTATVIDSLMVGDLRMWLYRAVPGQPDAAASRATAPSCLAVEGRKRLYRQRSDTQRVCACRVNEQAGAEFMKTSTVAPTGATIEDLPLIRRSSRRTCR